MTHTKETRSRAGDIARELVRWTVSQTLPDVEHDYEFVALRHDSEYPKDQGRLVPNRGLDTAMDQFDDHLSRSTRFPTQTHCSVAARWPAPVL